MSLFARSLAAVPAPRLDYPALTALLGTGDGHARLPARAPACGPNDEAVGDDPARPCLASVILGRPGWRSAARALRGSFGPAAGMAGRQHR